MAAAISMPLPEMISLPIPEQHWTRLSSVDELCDELTGHVLDCDLCLFGHECDCSTYISLQEQIAAKGGPSQGVAVAF